MVRAHVALVTFPVIFVGELPDKTMFASLILATKGHARRVWIGAAAAFALHVVIAVTIGVAMFALLPRRLVEGIVAVLFLAGAVYSWREGSHDESELVDEEVSRHGVTFSAFLVVFIAEWGDLTQILTANMAAKYHSALWVGVGAVLALWAVAALAVTSGSAILRVVKVATVRKVTAVVLVVLAAYTIWTMVR